MAWRRLSCVAVVAVIALGVSLAGSAATLTVKSAGGGMYTTIQAAIDAASAGDTIDVYPGTYNQDEALNRNILTGGVGTDTFNIFVNKALTIRGVDAAGVAITSYAGTLATISPKRSLTNSGHEDTIFVQADGVTIQGLSIVGVYSGNNKTVEITGDAFTMKYCKADGRDGAAAVYFYDPRYNPTTDTSHVRTYRIEGNYLYDGVGGGLYASGIRISSGPGWTGPASGRQIVGNMFQMLCDGVQFVGPGADPWDYYPVGAAIITGNTFTNMDRRSVIAWGTYKGVDGYPPIDWNGILAANTFDRAVTVWTSTGQLRTWTTGSFGDIEGIYSAIQRYPLNRVAQAGDKIVIEAGSYATQILTGLGVTLQGEAGSKILGSGTNKYTVAESGQTFAPVVFMYGGTLTGSAVSGPGVVQGNVKDLDIDGQNNAPSGARYVGVLLRNVDGTVSGNAIHDMYDADGQGNGPETFGVVVYGDSDVVISGNTIMEFSRGGIGVNGDTVGWARGPKPDPNAVIQGNTVTGNGYEAGTNWWAENGIQIGYGATGQVLDNTVTNCRVHNPSWSSTGILIVGSDGVRVSRNTASGSDNGIAIMGLTAWGGGPATGNVLSYNSVVGNESGIGLQYDAVNTQIIGNVITGNVGEGVYAYGNGGSAEPSGTVLRYNAISGNGYGLVNWGVLGAMDAILNWWGSASGPDYYAGLSDVNPTYAGGGDDVYGSVIFSPWLGTNPDGNPAVAGVQLLSPLLIVVDDVGPAPTGGYLNAGVGGANGLAGQDTILVKDGSFAASTPITDGASVLSKNGTGSTTITGALALNSVGTILGRLREGFTINAPVTVGAGVDASTIHINWNDIYSTVTNGGSSWLDATYNFWGEDGPDTVGLVNVYPYVPVPCVTLIGYMDERGLTAAEAITFAALSLEGFSADEALLVLELMETFGLGADEAGALIQEYGLGLVINALRVAGSPEEFVVLLTGYVADGGAGGGGAAEGDAGPYPVGAMVPLFIALDDPFTGEPVTDALVVYCMTRVLGDGSPQFVRFGVMKYDAGTGGYSHQIDSTGLEPGVYTVWIGTDDGRSIQYQITLTK